jgi:hypothetical protein
MNSENTAKILQISSNGAVVQLPGRNFPGIVVQGDSLSIIVKELMAIRSSMSDNKCDEDTLMDLDEIIIQLYSRIVLYEMTLNKLGLELPYNKFTEIPVKGF